MLTGLTNSVADIAAYLDKEWNDVQNEDWQVQYSLDFINGRKCTMNICFEVLF